MTEQDIIDRIRIEQEEQGNIVETLSGLCGYIGMFLFYMGIAKVFIPDETLQWQGAITLAFALVIAVTGMYGPEVAATYRARDKKYLIVFVFYGKRMVRRDIELLDDPLVVARVVDEKVEYIKPIDETDYEVAIRAIGGGFLTDKDVDKKMEDALKRRFEKAKKKATKKNIWSNPYKKDKGEE